MYPMKTTATKKLLLFVLCLSCFFSTEAATIYVRSTAAGANNGTSWADAYTSLQSALAAAISGDEIWVAAGVYKPSAQVDVDASGGSDAREVTFRLPDGVKVYGGFTGTEALLTERNWTANVTVLSGDIDNNDTNLDANFSAETIADIIGNNAYHVVYTANVTAATQLDGFVITAGRAYLAAPPNPNVPNLDGGGWYNQISAPQNASSPTIHNCAFQGNYAESEGAGFYTTPGTIFGAMESSIRGCKFIENRANRAGGAIFTGSFVKGNYRPVISQCEFADNQAYRWGGAIALTGDSARVDTCTFLRNRVTAISPDGSTLPGSGGGVSMVASKAGFRRCMFIENSATGNPTGAFAGGGGGAVYMTTNEPQTNSLGESKPVFIGCGFYRNASEGNTIAWGGAAVHLNDAGILRVKYINCVFSSNEAEEDGGAIANFTRVIVPPDYVPALRVDLTNCTFQGNAAGRTGGALYNDGYVSDVEILNVAVENSILHGNTAVISSPQIYNAGDVCFVSYSLVQGSGGSGGGWNASTGTDGGNNIDASPNFVNTADADGADAIPGTGDDGLRVQMGSLVINAGNSGATNLTGISTDFTGDARLQGSQVDMGAYERLSFVIPNPKIYWLYPWKIVRPVCLSCPWSIRLTVGINEKARYFAWRSPAQFIDYGDYAEVTGTIASQEDRSVQFEVYLKLVKPQDWKSWSSQHRTYKANTTEAQKTARIHHPDWTYWLLSDESYLKAKGRLEGTLQLSHAPDTQKTGFQLGIGGNAQDADFGLSGEFSYQGSVQRKGHLHKNKVKLKGVGSLNVDAQPCEQDCDLRTARMNNEDFFDASAQESKPDFIVYPNPAREQITMEWIARSLLNYSVQVYNFQGQQVHPRIIETRPGRTTLGIKDFVPGLYYIKLTDDTGNNQQRKVLVQQ